MFHDQIRIGLARSPSGSTLYYTLGESKGFPNVHFQGGAFPVQSALQVVISGAYDADRHHRDIRFLYQIGDTGFSAAHSRYMRPGALRRNKQRPAGAEHVEQRFQYTPVIIPPLDRDLTIIFNQRLFYG